MAEKRNNSTPDHVDRELVITRVLDAPRNLVFKAWTDAKRLTQWWGPHRFTSPICEADARPGGAIRINMCGPDGTIYPMTGVYQEIVEPERIVFASSALDGAGNWLFDILNTVTFEAQGGKTKLTLRAKVTKGSDKAFPYLAGMNEGWKQSLERLDGYSAIATDEIADRMIFALRILDAPRELVFKMWTDPQHIVHWWGPNGFTLTIDQMDVRPGGIWQFVMHGPNGVDYPNKIVYVEVVEPERLVYTHTGGVLFHSTVTFAEEGNQTRLTMLMLFDSAAERDRIEKQFGAVEGLKQTLGRLEGQLAKTEEKVETKKS